MPASPDVQYVPAPVAAPVSYLRSILVSAALGLGLGVVGAWLTTIAWFVAYGGENVVTDVFSGVLLGVLYALLVGPFAGILVAVPTGIVVAWLRKRQRAIRTVRLTAAGTAGVGMLLFVLLLVGTSQTTSTFGEAPREVSYGWVVPTFAALWSAGWAFLCSVWRPPVVVVDAPMEEPTAAPD